MSAIQMQTKVAQFAAYCAVNHSIEAVPHREFVHFEIERLKKGYDFVFNEEIPIASIVIVMLRGSINKLPGMSDTYCHMMSSSMPEYAKEVLKSLNIDLFTTNVNGIEDVPCWVM